MDRNTTRRLLLVALALAALLVPASSAMAAKQRFQVKFTGEAGQDWQVRLSDDETTPICVMGEGATGTSQFDVQTRGTRNVLLLADEKKGAVFGRVPVETALNRTVTLGPRPTKDCDYGDYNELASRLDCSQTGQWGRFTNPPAYVNVASGRGRVQIEVERFGRDEHLAEVFPFCPFAGVDEAKIEGEARLPAKKLFDGNPHTIRGKARNDHPGPVEHNVEGYSEWKLTIRAIPKVKRTR